MPKFIHFDGLAYSNIGKVMHEETIGSASGFSLEFDFDFGWPESEIFRMEEIVDSARIVDWRERKVLVLQV